MLSVLLVGIFLAPTLSRSAPSHYVGSKALFPCGIPSSNISLFLDGVRLSDGDPNIMIESGTVVIYSIPSEWNNTMLQCKGVSSDGSTEFVGPESWIIIYDQLVVQHPNIDVVSGVANISWSYPWTHLDSPLNCSVALYNKTDLSPVDTETTAGESYVVTDQEVVNCLACGGCFVNLTIESRDYTGPSLRHQHSETTAASRPSESYLNISVQETSVVVSFYLVPAVCEVTLLWMKNDVTDTQVLSASFDVVELGAESIGVSMVTLSISGLTVDTRASYVIGLRVVWNGTQHTILLKIPNKIPPKPKPVAPFGVFNATNASDSTVVPAIIGGAITGVVMVLFAVLVIIIMLAAAKKKCLRRKKKSYDPNASSVKLTDVEGTGSPVRGVITTSELTSGGLPIQIADTVPEESPQLNNTEPRSCPDVEDVQKENGPSKAEPIHEESSTEESEIACTPRAQPYDPAEVEGIQNCGSNTISVRAEVTPEKVGLPSEAISTPPESDSSTTTVSEEAEIAPGVSSSKDLPEITSTPPESDASTVSEEAEVTLGPQGYSVLLSEVAPTQGVQKATITSAPTPELTDDEGDTISESELFEAPIAAVNDQDRPKKGLPIPGAESGECITANNQEEMVHQEDGQYTDPQDDSPTSSLRRRQLPAQRQDRGDVEIATDGVGIQSQPKQFPNKYDDPDLL